MYKYISNAGDVSVVNSNVEFHDVFPRGVYTLKYSENRGMWFEKLPDIVVKASKVYGNHEELADIFYKVYEDRDNSTGILLTGLKGTGKTLISQLVSKKVLDDDGVVVLIDRYVDPGLITEYLNKVNGRVMIIFDEFEKNYQESCQKKLLNFLDGTHKAKRIVMIIANDTDLLTEYIFDRPNRVLFRKHFQGLGVDELNEVLDDLIGDDHEDLRSNLIKYVGTLNDITYDIVNNIVNMYVSYGLDFSQCLELLNIPSVSKAPVRVSLTINGRYDKIIPSVYNTPREFLMENNYAVDNPSEDNMDKIVTIIRRESSSRLEDVGYIVKSVIGGEHYSGIMKGLDLNLDLINHNELKETIWSGGEYVLESEYGSVVISKVSQREIESNVFKPEGRGHKVGLGVLCE